MLKIYKILLISILLVFPQYLNAHVQHYDKLKRIEFDIYRNNKHIGKHIFSFEKSDSQLSVKSEIKFEIKKLGIVLYKYHVKGTEVYEDGKLIKFNLKTVNDELVIDGSSYKGNAPKEFLLGTWWNHSIVEAPAQISAVSGRIIKQKVTFLGEESMEIGDKKFKTLHFNFSSTDKKLNKDKKLNTDVWYDAETLNWVKASFKKKGKWEYRLVLID